MGDLGRRRFAWLIGITSGVLLLGLIAAILVTVQAQRVLMSRADDEATYLRLTEAIVQEDADLTRNARKFAITGDADYLDEYWAVIDANAGGKAVAEFRRLGLPDDELDLLQQAKDRSDALTQVERTSMRLVLEAQGVPVARMRPELAAVSLNPGQQQLDADAQREQARLMVADDAYSQRKDAIAASLDAFAAASGARLSADVGQAQSTVFLAFRVLVALTLLVIVLIPGMLIANQRRLRRALREVALELSATAQEILATAEQQERTAVEQLTAAGQTTQTMVHLNESAALSAQQAMRAAEAAEQALLQVEEGMRQLAGTRQVAQELTAKSEQSGQQIVQLAQQVGRIRGISAAVRDLATQTNLLALNAAVEAARAGEAGRGFSVVAEEIRKLADESGESAERIGILVDAILKGSDRAVESGRIGAGAVNEVLEATGASSRAFDLIRAASGATTASTQEIVRNLQQQSAEVNEALAAMTAVKTGASETAAGISQLRSGVEGMHAAGERLMRLV